MKRIVICGGGVMLLALVVMNAEARPQYKNVVQGLDATTPAETTIQASVVANKCNACHVNKKKKTFRNEYGEALHNALGGGDKDNYTYNKADWKKQGGAYKPEVIQLLRDAINNVEE
ncbi:MAG: hypothetical protein DWQ31_21215 [Planctomycetota bacterium]|nr:MAG: hypothetical protein DWQ31_21215 [Planctomycetota bacterium]REJ93626.1 MAG: hypothetical protein DWQ35_09750 [Planctomycetota bacterium]REK25675.1 MAG: hypothetical protein DWQ42_10490 [Planctomycetota bacterium]REK46579.1 MAG: hypothetical protein DWQ46_06815 [Planctomycetota bacterium]